MHASNHIYASEPCKILLDLNQEISDDITLFV